MLFSKVSSFGVDLSAFECFRDISCPGEEICEVGKCVEVAPCLKDDDSWKDWGEESCQYYANRPLECGEYDRFSHLYPDFPATNHAVLAKAISMKSADELLKT